MSLTVDESFGLLYKLNRFLPEIIVKTLYSSLMHPYLSYGIEALHETCQNYASKIVFLQNKAKRARSRKSLERVSRSRTMHPQSPPIN